MLKPIPRYFHYVGSFTPSVSPKRRLISSERYTRELRNELTMMVTVSLYDDFYWRKCCKWVCPEVIEAIRTPVNEGLPPLRAYVGTG